MKLLVALAAVALVWATAALPTSSAAAATFAHQSALDPPYVSEVAAARARHGFPNNLHEKTNQNDSSKRRLRRILVESWPFENKHSQNPLHKKNIFVITNDCKASDRNLANPKLRILRADGTEIILGTSSGIFRPPQRDEGSNVVSSLRVATATKSEPPKGALDRANKAFIDALEQQRMWEKIPHFFLLPRPLGLKNTSKVDDRNEVSGEINVWKVLSQGQLLHERTKKDKMLTRFLYHPSGAGAGEQRVVQRGLVVRRRRSPLELGLVHGVSVSHHGSSAAGSAHHSVVLHPPPSKPPHAVQVSALHGVPGLITHAVVDPALHITSSTTVLTHDKAVVIPVVALAHPAHSLFRAHVGGFGVGLDFGGHGAGHGFYAAASAFAFR